MVNLFSLRATDPKDMKKSEHPVGPDHDRVFEYCSIYAGKIVAAWGNDGEYKTRAKEILNKSFLRDETIYCLKKNKSGSPAHPLYLSKNLKGDVIFRV